MEMVATVVTVPTMNALSNRPRNREIMLRLSGTLVPLICLVERARPVSNFIQTLVGHRP